MRQEFDVSLGVCGVLTRHHKGLGKGSLLVMSLFMINGTKSENSYFLDRLVDLLRIKRRK